MKEFLGKIHFDLSNIGEVMLNQAHNKTNGNEFFYLHIL